MLFTLEKVAGKTQYFSSSEALCAQFFNIWISQNYNKLKAQYIAYKNTKSIITDFLR